MSTVAFSPAEPPEVASSDLEEVQRLTVKEKWQGAVTGGSGFVAVPMSLLRLQSKYDLSATDMLVLINLLAHWWDPAQPVYPRSTTIAKRMGVTKRTVQRSTDRLLKSGMMERDFLENGRRVFSFDLLAHRLSRDLFDAYAIDKIERDQLKKDNPDLNIQSLNENEPPPTNSGAAQTLRSSLSRRSPQE